MTTGANGGVVPASADWREGIRLAVLDVDRGDAGALTAAYRPVALAETRHGSHAWYLSDDPPAVNATWSGPGGTGGEYRGLHGYAALHGDELAIVDAGLSRIGRGGCGRGDLPVHLLGIEGHRKNERASRRVLVNVASALVRFAGRATGGHGARAQGRRGRHPPSGACAGHGANEAGASRGTLARSMLTGLPDAGAAYWLGMPDRRTFGEVEAKLASSLGCCRPGVSGWHGRTGRSSSTSSIGAASQGEGPHVRRQGAGVSARHHADMRRRGRGKLRCVHRATWYRRRARAGRATNANGSPAGS